MNERHKEIIDLYSSGKYSTKEICEITGYTEGSLRTICCKYGIKRNSNVKLEKDETFKPIRHIKSLEHYEVSNYAKIRNSLTGRILSSKPHHQSGYMQTRLVDANGSKITVLNHKMMGNEFLGVDKDKTLDHIDRDRTNNDLKNIRYATREEQAKNVKPRKSSKLLKVEEVYDICDKLQNGLSIAKIVKTNENYTKSKVEKIRQRVRWTDISKEYKW